MNENQVVVYHYSSVKFDKFDLAKCDGFWFTDIAPDNEEMLNEIGANSSKYCAKCVIEIESPEFNGPNHDIEGFILDNDCDGIINRYEGFTDYVLIDNSKIQILEWLEV